MGVNEKYTVPHPMTLVWWQCIHQPNMSTHICCIRSCHSRPKKALVHIILTRDRCSLIRTAEKIESVQKRTMRSIHPELHYTEYTENLYGHPWLIGIRKRRYVSCHVLFTEIQSNDHKLNHLLPSQKKYFYSLRNTMKYTLPKYRTNRYRHIIISYRLLNFQ